MTLNITFHAIKLFLEMFFYVLPNRENYLALYSISPFDLTINNSWL